MGGRSDRWGRLVGVVVTVVSGIAAGGCAGRSPPPAPPPLAGPVGEKALALFVPGTASPQRKAKLNAIAARLDEVLQGKMRQSGATALAAGVVLDGELAYARAWGARKVAAPVTESTAPPTVAAVDADTVFRIASMTKSFTAMAILKLRDQGRLALDADASTYLPELRTLGGLPRDATITVRMLLTHASGLPGDDYWGGDTFGMTEDELTRFMQAGVKLSRAPGEQYAYSNLGYALLGRIVEVVSGRRFRDYVSDNILQPLGMQASVWEAADVPPDRLATGYWKRDGVLTPEPLPPDGVFDAAGGLYTSLHDYARYVAFNLAAYPARDEEPERGPLRRSTLREMHQGQRWSRTDDRDAPVARREPGGISLRASSYGFGWERVITCGDERVQHGGYEPGYFSTVVMLPRHGVGVFVLATTARVGAAVLLPALVEAGLLSAPVGDPPIPDLLDAAASINQLVGGWDPALVARTFDQASARFSWSATLRDDFALIGARHGRCRPRGELTTYGRHRGVWRLACDRGTVELDALMTPGTPARVEILKWSDELPANDQQRAVASRVAAALGRWKDIDATADALMADRSDRPRLRRAMAHLAIDYGTCGVEGGVVRTSHEPFGDDSPRTTFRLKCAGGALDLQLTIEGATGRILDLEGHPPRDPDATCF